MDTPFVSICANCQKENPAVDSAVKSHSKDIKFSHGICKRHALEMLKQMDMRDDKISEFMKKLEGNGPPDLKENPELVKAYSKGLFTPEQIQQANQTQQTENNKLVERLQSLAGIPDILRNPKR